MLSIPKAWRMSASRLLSSSRFVHLGCQGNVVWARDFSVPQTVQTSLGFCFLFFEYQDRGARLIVRSFLMPRLKMRRVILPLHLPPWFTEEHVFTACNLLLVYYISISSAVATVFFFNLMKLTGIRKVSFSGLGYLYWELYCHC